MCGIAGFFDLQASLSRDQQLERITSMTRSLRHRGPDDEGIWAYPQSGVALGHRRLSIVDLSAAGRQPMISADGRYVIVYNGEVYNADELRSLLKRGGHSFTGHSDTEVLIEGIAAWGVENCVKKLIGMFAFAVWDRQEATLSLVRDRLGIKPLYWGLKGSLYLFGSELKALRAFPGWKPEIDRNTLATFIRDRFVGSPHSIYQDVHVLAPGQILHLSKDGTRNSVVYWDPITIAKQDEIELTDLEATDQLEQLLRDAVGRRMVADVPLGAFLSGGIDSSVVTALMQDQSSRPVRTFSIGFHESGYDEAPYSRAVAAHLGTDHTELYVTPKDALDLIPQLPEIFDEPFADSSQIPTYILAALTRKDVTVALSGDGGDELFAGYDRYRKALRMWNQTRRVPLILRQLGASGMRAMASLLGREGPAQVIANKVGHNFSDRLTIWSGRLGAKSFEDLYQQRSDLWRRPEEMVRGVDSSTLASFGQLSDVSDLLTRMQIEDILTYLPDDILTKVDRATMAVALEARVPILDHRVAEFALRLPREQKVRGGESKWILRQVLRRFVPGSLIDRPKSGFSVPLASWLRGPLRDWAEDLLDERRLREDGYFHPAPIRRRWQQHLDGEWDWQTQLWQVLVFQAWLRHGGAGTVS